MADSNDKIRSLFFRVLTDPKVIAALVIGFAVGFGLGRLTA